MLRTRTVDKSVRHLSKNLMVADKIKFSSVPSPEVTQSDFTIGFRAVDLAGGSC